ncbi:hypothetical protein [Lysobacter capsici]|uniref:hypothetical protein n=1 Tax=Lysobacter capsici TaxID=435897 RepID=UPI001C008226|nr:hypothetical protein [Lysobacter capsici]QWF18631.1 hypothetical protein KME82_07755 [Lysobacter capsici]
MRLPDTLKPWHAWLGWFDPELAGVLGELMLRLHPLLGAFRMRALRGAVEPEGIDDLRRRGSYERLLLSEWALAEVVPEEFDRRAAAGEHLFLSPKLVAREVDALTVAVFDTGPTQLGAPRLVHVAMWILLAQRAQAAKARFAWGVLGKPGELFDADNADALKQLLNERSFTPGGEAAWQRAAQAGLPPPREDYEREWQQRLDAAQPSPGERWSIGSHAHGYGLGHRVDVQRAGENELAIVIAARQARRETRLALPAAAPSSRLLRGKFKLPTQPAIQAPKTKGRLSLKQAPIVSATGYTIAAIQDGTNAANVYRLPSEEAEQRPPATLRWAKRKNLLAATLDGTQFGALLANGSNLDFWQLIDFDHAPLPSEVNVAAAQARYMPCFRMHRGHRGESCLYLLAGRKLLCWQRQSSRQTRYKPTRFVVAEDGVLAIADHGREKMIFLRLQNGQLALCSIDAVSQSLLQEVPLQGEVSSGFLAGRLEGGQWRGGACVEVPVGGHGGERSTIWRVFRWSDGPREDHEIILPSDWKVLGLRQSAGNQIDLIALRPDRRGVVRIGKDGRSTLYESVPPISVGTVATAADTIALIDQYRSLVVLRDNGQSVLFYRSGDD